MDLGFGVQGAQVVRGVSQIEGLGFAATSKRGCQDKQGFPDIRGRARVWVGLHVPLPPQAGGMGMPKIETAISRIYAKEVEEMVRWGHPFNLPHA